MGQVTRQQRAQARAVQRHRGRMLRRSGRDARFYHDMLVKKSIDLGFHHWTRDRDMSGKPKGYYKQRIHFLKCEITDEAFYYEVDTTRLPYKIGIRHVLDEDTLLDLGTACRRKVTARHSITGGLWLIVWRDEGVAGVPRRVKFSQVYNALPKSAPPLAFVVGVGENRRLVYHDIAALPHLLIAGSTGQGKSVFLNQILCTLIQRNKPDVLQLLMIDLKGGVELGFYRKLPHLIAPIVTESEDVAPALLLVLKEIDRRLARFQKADQRKIEGWNKMRPAEVMPRLVVVFDEVAEALIDPDRINRKANEVALTRIVQKGRAAGVHMLAATQRPDADTVKGLIRQNLPARAAFACASPGDSRTIINNARAFQLSPRGRMIWSFQTDQVELQGPEISEHRTAQICRYVRAGYVDPEIKQLDFRDLLRHALQHYGGSLARRALLADSELRAAGWTEPGVRRVITGLKGHVVSLDGKRWLIDIPVKGRAYRMLPAPATAAPDNGAGPAEATSYYEEQEAQAWFARLKEHGTAAETTNGKEQA